MNIAVLNKSTLVLDSEVEKMTQAVQLQLDLHVALMWGKLPPVMNFYSHQSEVPENADVILLFDDPDTAGALGYHTQGPNGEAYAKVFVRPVLENGGGVLDGGSAGMSVASVLSHEAAELFIDRTINMWFDGPTLPEGSSYAGEVCDPVESDCYSVIMPDNSQVLVSNFVGPNWFDQMAPKDEKRDWMDTTSAPFQLSKGGYQVVRQAPGSEKEVFHQTPPPAWKMAGKTHGAARTAKRRHRA